MIAKYVQRSDSIDYIPGASVSAGDVIVIGGIVGIAKTDITSGTLGALATEGVYDGVKVSGASIGSGAAVYYDATASAFTATDSGTTLAGHAIGGALAADTVVRFILNK